MRSDRNEIPVTEFDACRIFCIARKLATDRIIELMIYADIIYNRYPRVGKVISPTIGQIRGKSLSAQYCAPCRGIVGSRYIVRPGASPLVRITQRLVVLGAPKV